METHLKPIFYSTIATVPARLLLSQYKYCLFEDNGCGDCSNMRFLDLAGGGGILMVTGFYVARCMIDLLRAPLLVRGRAPIAPITERTVKLLLFGVCQWAFLGVPVESATPLLWSAARVETLALGVLALAGMAFCFFYRTY